MKHEKFNCFHVDENMFLCAIAIYMVRFATEITESSNNLPFSCEIIDCRVDLSIY